MLKNHYLESKSISEQKAELTASAMQYSPPEGTIVVRLRLIRPDTCHQRFSPDSMDHSGQRAPASPERYAMIVPPQSGGVRTLRRLPLCFTNLQFAFCILQFAIFFFGTTSACPAAVHVEAYRGEPFGIGRVTIDLPPGASSAPASDDRFVLAEADDRVLYPAMKNSSARRILRDFLGIETPLRVSFIFMFRGDEPLELVAYTPTPQQLTAHPEDNAIEFNNLLDEWWDATSDRYAQVFRQAEYPVLVENYLTATWARRLNREMPEPKRYLFQRFGIGAPWISQLMANEAYQTQVESDLLAGPLNANDAGMIPIPKAPLPLRGEEQSEGDSELPTPNSPLPTSDRTPRRARPRRMLLHAIRQLHELPLVPRLQAPLAGRSRQHARRR